MRCEKVRHELLAQTFARREIAPESDLGRHLHTCSECRAFLRRIVEVDAALAALPLEAAPPDLVRHVWERIAALPVEPIFLPWTVWVPAASLILGLVLAYLTLIWRGWYTQGVPSGSGWIDWPVEVQRWLGGHQSSLSVVTLSISLGILITLLGIGLGLYLGRQRPASGPQEA